MSTRRPGPKTEVGGPFKPRTVLIDELAERMLLVLGEQNLSKGVRVAARMAYDRYQKETKAASAG
mgnify:CR=1 FL=1